jgi:hypothetical protein
MSYLRIDSTYDQSAACGTDLLVFLVAADDDYGHRDELFRVPHLRRDQLLLGVLSPGLDHLVRVVAPLDRVELEGVLYEGYKSLPLLVVVLYTH